jgi:hypothetical protein
LAVHIPAHFRSKRRLINSQIVYNFCIPPRYTHSLPTGEKFLPLSTGQIYYDRDRILRVRQALEGEMREVLQTAVIKLDSSIWCLNFVIPARQRMDAHREQEYRQSQAGAIKCPHCGYLNDPDANFCNDCQRALY